MGARELALVLTFSVIGGCWQLGDDGVNREDYRNITSAVNIWELHPSSINAHLFDIKIMCDEPSVRELGESVKNCRSIHKTFPSNLGLCDVCGENVTIQCWRNQVGLRTWYPTSITASDIRTCAVPFPPLVVRCPPPKYSAFYCHDKTEPPGHEGDTLDCQCRTNCRSVNVECKSDGQWGTKNSNLSNICQDLTVTKVQNQLTITYTNKEYSYSCAPGYKLVGAATRVCTAGVLEGQEPSCEQEGTVSHLETLEPGQETPTEESLTTEKITPASPYSLLFFLSLVTNLLLTMTILYILKSRIVSLCRFKRADASPERDQSEPRDNVPINRPAAVNANPNPAGPSRPENVPGPRVGPVPRPGPSANLGGENPEGYLEMLEGPPVYEEINERRESNVYDVIDDGLYDDVGPPE